MILILTQYVHRFMRGYVPTRINEDAPNSWLLTNTWECTASGWSSLLLIHLQTYSYYHNNPAVANGSLKLLKVHCLQIQIIRGLGKVCLVSGYSIPLHPSFNCYT